MIDSDDASLASTATALVLGATGLVGGHLLDLLLADDAWKQVTVLGRRRIEREHPRLRQVVADMDRMEEHADAFAVDHVFCCLGTTIRAAGSQQAFRRVDFDYVAESARLAARQGARRYLLVTAAGASPRSRVFYSRVKGEAEEAVRAQPLDGVVILRPSLILGDRAERRTAEDLAQRMAPVMNRLLIGPLRRYRAVRADVIARAMARLARQASRGVRVVESDEIQRIGGA